MLGDENAHTDIAVKDIEKARQFYKDTLGLTESRRDERGDTYYRSGTSTIKIYQSNFAGTNQATYMSWDANDVRATVDDLKSKGVNFEHYDMPGVIIEDDVHIIGEERAAWFKDPDGNILCVGGDH